MKPPNRLGIYSDVQQILDAALSAGGGIYTCQTYGQAVHWRQRAYKFRKLYAEIHGAKINSVYDKITMPRISEGSPDVHILIRQQVGTFTPTEGGVPFELPLDDDLLSEALDFANKLGGTND